MPTTKNFTQTTEKKNLFEEIKSHKKEIIVTSVLLGVTIAGVLIYKRMSPNELTRIKENISCNLCANKELSSLESTAPTATNIIEFSLGKTSTVPGHPRNLPSGHKPSEKQLEIAKSLGINLADNQTYVTDYSRKIA
ncbi:MAG: hypothetical protein IKJ73_01115 [Lachnospiraceae bacterium]|nr:hypothetical protein [Lachnospiraceae bacterium]MCI6497492.1 hypothetical protein [Lachnospiraceae bacterium]